MSLLELGVVIIAIVLFVVALVFKRGIVWFLPLAYCSVAFYLAVTNSWSAFVFVPLGGIALISLIVGNIKMFKGEII